ncbi:MAG: T9SS type A sorting domain-containing protein [Ignavibacteria bacterium]|nr:MAG: T9SS type A sorting domain-containing protein [Ignavibacteria bacterium]
MISTDAGNQWNVHLVSDGHNGAIMVWQDRRDGTNDKLYVQRVSSSGNILWKLGGLQLATSAGLQFYPQIISDEAGGAFIVWQDNRLGLDYDIFAQRISPDGISLWVPNGALVCNALGHQYNPQIIPDGQGGVLIVWQDKRSGDFDIYAQRLGATGLPMWSLNGEYVCSQPGDQVEPKIVSDGLHGAIVTWTDYRAGTGFSDIYAQRMSAAGQRAWSVDGVPVCMATNMQWNVQLASDGLGGGILSWQDRRSGLYDNVYAQRIDVTGHAKWTEDGVQLAATSGLQYYPKMVGDGSGGAVVAWQDNRRGSDYDIYSQRIGASGQLMWARTGQPICTAKGHQYNPEIACQNTTAIITWQDKRSGEFDIYAQCLNPDGSPAWKPDGAIIAIPPHDQMMPQLCSDSVEGAIIAWPDFQRGDGTTDIFCHRIGANGRLAGGCFRSIGQTGYAQKPAKYRNKFTGFISMKPNEGNVRDSIFARGYFPNGILNGVERLDSARRYGWQRFTSPFYLMHALPQNGTARPFDRLFERFFVGLMRNPSVRRYNNALAGELTTLKLNIAASDAGITESEFGDIVFVDTSDRANPLNKKSLRQVAAYPRTNYVKVGYWLSQINSAFAANLDTVSTSPLTLTTTSSLLSIPYLIPGSTPAPTLPQVVVPQNMGEDTPSKFKLLQNYPNPFNPMTTIEFELSEPAIVTLKVFNVLGQQTAVLIDQSPMDEGPQLVDFDASNLSSGVYFYQLLAERLSGNGLLYSNVRKMVFLK